MIELADMHSSQVFARCVLNKTKKSPDFLRTIVERYRLVFDHCFVDDKQSVLVE